MTKSDTGRAADNAGSVDTRRAADDAANHNEIISNTIATLIRPEGIGASLVRRSLRERSSLSYAHQRL
jgi:hypothetical protein